MSRVPGRSFLYYEWWERGEGESTSELAVRQRAGRPDTVRSVLVPQVKY